MTKDQIIEYHVKNDQLRYQAAKEGYKTLKQIVITLLVCLSLVTCFWIYFGMPNEDILVEGDGSKAIIENKIEGSGIWQ